MQHALCLTSSSPTRAWGERDEWSRTPSGGDDSCYASTSDGGDAERAATRTHMACTMVQAIPSPAIKLLQSCDDGMRECGHDCTHDVQL